jgi:HEAT repeat protein
MAIQRLLNILFSPTVALVIAGAVMVIIVAVIVVNRIRDRRRILRFARTPAPLRSADTLPEKHLLRRSALIARAARRHTDIDLIRELGVAPLWISRLLERGQAGDFYRVLRFCPDDGLYACFVTALGNRKQMARFLIHLGEDREGEYLEALALASDGRRFTAESATELRDRWFDHLMILAGHPEWLTRNFAIQMLRTSESERARAVVAAGLSDPHPQNRMLAVEVAEPDLTDQGATLARLVVDDPDARVRRAAASRLRALSLWERTIRLPDLSTTQRAHVAPLLDASHGYESSIALDWLEGGTPETQYPAAVLLDQAGVLQKLLEEADFGDRTGLQRRRTILSNAIDVRVTGFLSVLESSNRPATLLLGAELLAEHGDPDLIRVLAERVFRMQERAVPNYVTLYEAVTEAIGLRGDDAALMLLIRQLLSRKRPELIRAILNAVPQGRDSLFADPLFSLLSDESFPERPALRRAILRLDSARILAACFTLLDAESQPSGSQLQIDALSLVSQLDLKFSLRPALERIGAIDSQTVTGFLQVSHSMDRQRTEDTIADLLDSGDAPIRAALLRSLPDIDTNRFSASLRDAVLDSDPDVRAAAISSLDRLDALDVLGGQPGLVRDPVPRVRSRYAVALARSVKTKHIAILREAVLNPDELEEVRLSVIESLAGNPAPHAAETLLDLLEAPPLIADAAVAALATLPDAEGVRIIARRFIESSPAVQDRIAVAAQSIAQTAEDLLRESTTDADGSDVEALSSLFEATGFAAELVHRLRHRDPAYRAEAARTLGRLTGVHAAAGVVLASWDSDPSVQEAVAEPLERLKEELPEELRSELQAHPMRRVRKYTERIFGPIG